VGYFLFCGSGTGLTSVLSCRSRSGNDTLSTSKTDEMMVMRSEDKEISAKFKEDKVDWLYSL